MSTIEKKMINHTKETEERENREERISECLRLARDYGHEAERYGVTRFVDASKLAKSGLEKILSRHPLWNAKGCIEKEITIERLFDEQGVDDFTDWVHKELHKYCRDRRIKIGMFEYYEYQRNLSDLQYKRYCCTDNMQFYGGRHMSELDEEIKRRKKRLNNANARDIYFGNEIIAVDPDLYSKAAALRLIIDSMYDHKTRLIEESVVLRLQEYADILGLNVKVNAGMKKTRLMQMACAVFGFDKVKDFQTVSWTDQNSGEYHERTADRGWNYQFAKFCDAVSPKKIKKILRYSTVPMDYLTMSFGTNWASCQTIDINNIRGCDNSYHGQYCSGTVGLALDETTLVAYIVGNEEKYGEYSKEKRCLFSFGEDKLIQHRVYPDGRDGGCGIDYAGIFRSELQDIIAECVGYKEVWKLVNEVPHGIYRKWGTHYNDLTCSDCAVSYMVDENGNKNLDRIDIGCEPICFVSGNDHETEGYLYDEYNCRCEYCDANLRREDALYAEDSYGDTVYFCDSYCADQEGYVSCEDGECHPASECWLDSYSGDWYYNQEPEVETEDGHKYRTVENAYNDGYVYVESEYGWYSESETVYDDYDGESYLDNSDIITVGDLHFGSSENAIAYGCVYNEETKEWEVA